MSKALDWNRWTGFGFGGASDGMRNADMYIGWMSNGQPVVSYRIGTNDDPALTSSSNGFQTTTPNLTAPGTGYTTVFSFKRPLKTNGKSLSKGQSTTFIYAATQSGVSGNRASATAASLSIHSITGRFRIDFTSNSSSIGGAENEGAVLRFVSKQKVDLFHGFSLVFAWAVSPFLGIFVARYWKQKLGHWWFRWHVIFMGWITSLVTVVASVLMCLSVSSGHFNNAHKILGLFVLLAVVFQFFLGIMSDQLWTAQRKTIPWWDKLHWWTGRIILVIALANCHLGLNLMDATLGWFIAFWAVVGLGFALLLFGQFKYGQQHH